MEIINLDRKFSGQILAIFNDVIENSTALYDYKPRTAEDMKVWFDIKENKGFPVIGIIDRQENLLAFGTYGAFRERPANKYTVEHSLYIHKEHRGKGLGKRMLSEIIKTAQQNEYRCLVAAIDSVNEASAKLHKDLGFEFCGRIREVAYKFSEWLDLDFYQLLLPGPVSPNEN